MAHTLTHGGVAQRGALGIEVQWVNPPDPKRRRRLALCVQPPGMGETSSFVHGRLL
ncbi:hypothetical protein [Verminephrobacter eiseniae]|uniref:hypothetical protein n=1 Tax=Verminephrobacter eiseniae TaxID=364317 RepID=UPI0022438461|nr:hypothetical protein [Verminephrobacter eiseniae]